MAGRPPVRQAASQVTCGCTRQGATLAVNTGTRACVCVYVCMCVCTRIRIYKVSVYTVRWVFHAVIGMTQFFYLREQLRKSAARWLTTDQSNALTPAHVRVLVRLWTLLWTNMVVPSWPTPSTLTVMVKFVWIAVSTKERNPVLRDHERPSHLQKCLPGCASAREGSGTHQPPHYLPSSHLPAKSSPSVNLFLTHPQVSFHKRANISWLIKLYFLISHINFNLTAYQNKNRFLIFSDYIIHYFSDYMLIV